MRRPAPWHEAGPWEAGASDLAPDLIEPIVGWRVWRIARAEDGWQLQSVRYGGAWPVGQPLVARCQRAWSVLTLARRPWRHPAPALGCECGIHAAADPAALAPYTIDPPRHLSRPWLPRAVGRVRLWGTVVAAPLGWRASHAYPDHLSLLVDDRVPTGAVDEILTAMSRYGVPVQAVDGGEGIPAGLETVTR